MYHVYELLDPVTNTPFYIGKGSGGSMTRLDDHLNEATKPPEEQTNQIKCNKINSILRNGNSISHRLHMCATEDEAYEMEREMIRLLGRKIDNSGILTNICPGGRGGWGNFGKRVYRFDMDGNIMKEYPSLKSAALDINVTPSAIWSCLNETRPNTQCGGSIWSRTPELSQKCIDAVRSRRKQPNLTYQIDVHGNTVQQFTTTREAAEAVGVSWWAIGMCIKDQTKTCEGAFWSDHIPCTITVLEHYTNGILQGRYINVRQAAIATGISASAIGRHIRGEFKQIRGSQFKFATLTVTS